MKNRYKVNEFSNTIDKCLKCKNIKIIFMSFIGLLI